METSENIKEISEILKKYEISTIEQLEHILFKRKSNNESLKMKYQKNEDYREKQKENAKVKINQKYQEDEEFRTKQRERCLARYYEKKEQLKKN